MLCTLSLSRQYQIPNIPARAKESEGRVQGFPNVVGAIDGTLVHIQGMTGDEEPTFICRKGFHAINIQAVAVANLRYMFTTFHKLTDLLFPMKKEVDIYDILFYLI